MRLSDYFPSLTARRLYVPGMMTFNGSTSRYDKTITSSGNKTTALAVFAMRPFTGGGNQTIAEYVRTAGAVGFRILLRFYASDHATSTLQNKLCMYVTDSAGAGKCNLISTGDYLDGKRHTVMAGFDGDAGTAFFIVDGLNADDTGHGSRVAPATATLNSGASTSLTVGTNLGLTQYVDGDIGFLAVDDAYHSNWQDFIDEDGQPRKLDVVGWSQFGGTQPLFFNPSGEMTNNLGSAGDMTKTGTIEAWDGSLFDIRRQRYTPALMKFDGSTGYYNKTSLTTSGNDVTAVLRFSRNAFTGGSFEYLMWLYGVTGIRCAVVVFSSDHASRASKVQVDVQNSAGTAICKLISTMDVDDGSPHTLFFSFDGDVGAAQFYVDGVNADDTGHGSRVAPTTGTLGAGSGGLYVGSTQTPANHFGGDIGFFGHREAYLTNWADFMDSNGEPKPLDESGWTEWGGVQPEFWNEHADMINNLGSAGAMTKNGTIIVGDGGN